MCWESFGRLYGDVNRTHREPSENPLNWREKAVNLANKLRFESFELLFKNRQRRESNKFGRPFDCWESSSCVQVQTKWWRERRESELFQTIANSGTLNQGGLRSIRRLFRNSAAASVLLKPILSYSHSHKKAFCRMILLESFHLSARPFAWWIERYSSRCRWAASRLQWLERASIRQSKLMRLVRRHLRVAWASGLYEQLVWVACTSNLRGSRAVSELDQNGDPN